MPGAGLLRIFVPTTAQTDRQSGPERTTAPTEEIRPATQYIYMKELTLTTPTLLFSAVSLILLAYTNRFLSYAQLIRSLKEVHLQNPSKVTRAQIDNLRRRLRLTRTMQILGVTSLFLCVVTMFLIYIGLQTLSGWVFGIALLLLIASLGVSIREIQISVRALEIHLHDMEG